MTFADPAQGAVAEQGTGEQNGAAGGEQEQSDGMASSFLSRIPDADRAVVEKYVKQWDAGVTRRFQELHKEYEPYKGLGELEELQKARELYGILDEDPERLYNALKEVFGEEVAGQQQNQQNETNGEVPEYQGALDEFQAKFDQQTQVLEALAQYVLNQESQSKESSEDKELEDYMGLLKEEFGQFDEDYVLTKMYHGASGEDAVKAYQDFVQQITNQAGSVGGNLPTFISSSGGGGVPHTPSQKLGDASSKDIQALVVDVLRQSNSG